ncbi:MAG: hypothetical protein ACRDBQ_21275 [Shewanella sp.]
MAVIRFFATNGHRQTKSSAPIDYLLGIYSALTPQQKMSVVQSLMRLGLLVIKMTLHWFIG